MASRRTWKWTQKLFFHLLALAIVNSYILLPSCGGKKIPHRDFRLTLIREMLAWAGHEPWPSMPVGRPAQSSTNIGRLDTSHNKHWPGRSQTKPRCHVFSRGREAKCHIQICEVWRGALCSPRVFPELSYKAQLIRHLFLRPPYKQLKPRPQCK